MRSILLTRGKFAIVDDEDFEWLSQWKWYCSATGYAVRTITTGKPIIKGKYRVRMLYMHRLVAKTSEGMDTDHINGDRLDNRKKNLRSCFHKENVRNQQRAHKDNESSVYKGVCFDRNRKKWRCRVGGKHIGDFDSELEAAIAYNKSAVCEWGEFATLNQIGELKCG